MPTSVQAALLLFSLAMVALNLVLAWRKHFRGAGVSPAPGSAIVLLLLLVLQPWPLWLRLVLAPLPVFLDLTPTLLYAVLARVAPQTRS